MVRNIARLCVALISLSVVACEGGSSSTSTTRDSGSADEPDDGGSSTTDERDAGVDGGVAEDHAAARREDAGSESDAEVPDCYADPKTYEEIINACTDAEKVDKQPILPRLLADGGLPDLP
jgi:hypothetical protein